MTAPIVPPLPPRSELTTEKFLDWIRDLPIPDTPAAPAQAAVTTAADRYAPKSWTGFIGQADTVRELTIRAAAARARGGPMASVLLLGPDGTGKALLAQLVANDLEQPLVDVPRPCTVSDLTGRLRHAPHAVVYLADVHRWKGRHETDLVTFLAYTEATVIGGTADPGHLPAAVAGSFSSTRTLDRYDIAEMTSIVAGMALRAGLPVPIVSLDFQSTLGAAAAGSPRAAMRLVQAAADLHDATGSAEPGEVLRFAGVEPDGMTVGHLRYLTALASTPRDAVGPTSLAQMTGLPVAQLIDLERLLIDRGLVVLTGRGRQITPSGTARVQA